MELCDKSAAELAQMLRKQETSSRSITESVLRRIKEKETGINAFITILEEEALKQADEADMRFQKGRPKSLIDGIPVAIKDNLCTKGIKTTCASKILKDYIPPYNATAVQKVIDHGAVLVGKTNLDEFAMGSSTENSIFGPTRNPVNTNCVPGGSSGGSAAAVRTGETILAIGSDTGGSIRQPAAFCGVTGIKPTYGRISRYGLIAYASSLDQVGAIGKTAEDCALLLNSICGHDRQDSTSINSEVPDFTVNLKKGVKGIKIGLPKEYFVKGLDPRIKNAVMNAAELMEKQGATIVEVSLPHTKYAVSAYYIIATSEASSNLARFDGVKYGFRKTDKDANLIDMYETTRGEGFGKEVKRRIMLGTYVLSAGYYDAYYLKAQKVRTLIQKDFNTVFKTVDCLFSPVSPVLPFAIGEKTKDPLKMYLVDIYTVSLNLTGLPGLSLKCGTADDLPIGLQITGRPMDEETLLRIGYTFEHYNSL